MLGNIADDDESSIATHLRALGISSSGVIRGAVQFGTNQVIIVAQLFASGMSFINSSGSLAFAVEHYVPPI